MHSGREIGFERALILSISTKSIDLLLPNHNQTPEQRNADQKIKAIERAQKTRLLHDDPIDFHNACAAA